MSADRCPTCDRKGCPAENHWKQYRAAEDAGNYDLAVESLALFDGCGCERVDWRARAIAAESDAAKWRKVEPLIDALREAAKVARHDYATEDDATVDHRVTGHELVDAVTNLLAATKEPS